MYDCPTTQLSARRSSVYHASLQTLMIGHTFLVLLIPLLVALFYYSTPYSRRQPIFILNVLALTLAFLIAITTDALQIRALLSPHTMWSLRIRLMPTLFANFQMMLVDTILLVRLITVYPLSHVGLVRFVLLTSLPIVLKIARVVNMSLYIFQLNSIVDSPHGSQRIVDAFHVLPYQKIEWIAQVVDNSYASIAFLWTIRTSRTQGDTALNGLMSSAAPRQSSAAKRIRTLFRLALSNFMIPTVISIAQLVMLFRIGNGDPLTLSTVGLVNTMVAIFGVVFATVWAGKERRREVKALSDPAPMEREQRYTYPLDGWAGGLDPRSLPDENLATITRNYQSDRVGFTSDKDMSIMDNRDEDLVQVPDLALLPQQTRKSSASQDLQLFNGVYV